MTEIIGIENIKIITSTFFKVSIANLESKKKTHDIAIPRMMAMYYCTMMPEKPSLKSIGELFGGRDHSTVIHARNVIGSQVEIYPDVKKLYKDFCKAVKKVGSNENEPTYEQVLNRELALQLAEV